MLKQEIRAFQGRFGRAVLFDTNTPVVEHAHSQCHVLIKCGGADGHYYVCDERAPFRDDTIVLVNPWMPHRNPRRAGGPASRVLALYVETVWLSERSADVTSGRLKPFARPSAPISTLIRSLADHLAATMISGDSSEVRLEEILYDLIDQTLSSYATGKARSDLPRSTTTLDYRIRRAIAHMRDHISKEVEMSDLAQIAGLSRSRFFELFRSCTGVSPRLYMDALCIDVAARTLASTTHPLTEIARRLGFSAPGHFSRFFQQHTSVSPSDYRKAAAALRQNGGIPILDATRNEAPY
ncbi:AraC family transcriptional regulator [Bradyrhizobium sp. NP1]|uniref:helix-turn-helix domain-containing protein n=1 Tax=Bradyrhizobium sp. NP1 TaxID=3049772 RepID=UPI0025A5E3B8|nr:AraC family transcriptional regulator [Bradyrhizobium sp. NP1]WJR79884.1 AraC family transcriptional regulator [Bradyrhizobium sp. NP1]